MKTGTTTCSDLLFLQGLLGGHGVWTPELEKELVEWVNARTLERQRDEARAEAATWKQMYSEAVDRGNLFRSQRDEAREKNAKPREALEEAEMKLAYLTT
jgi:hypothetical protein